MPSRVLELAQTRTSWEQYHYPAQDKNQFRSQNIPFCCYTMHENASFHSFSWVRHLFCFGGHVWENNRRCCLAGFHNKHVPGVYIIHAIQRICQVPLWIINVARLTSHYILFSSIHFMIYISERDKNEKFLCWINDINYLFNVIPGELLHGFASRVKSPWWFITKIYGYIIVQNCFADNSGALFSTSEINMN